MILLVSSYVEWHYGRALRELARLFKNFVWFLFHFFSIRVLLQTFFKPWRRMSEQYHGSVLNVGDTLATLTINTLMRFVGVLCRSAVIFTGVCVIICATLIALACYVAWFALPLMVVTLFISGVHLLFL